MHNYEGEYLGPIDLDEGDRRLRQLRLLPAHARRRAGERRRRRRTRSASPSPLQSYFAIGLGVEPVSLLEMARAYATFANGGVRIDGSVFGNEPRA